MRGFSHAASADNGAERDEKPGQVRPFCRSRRRPHRLLRRGIRRHRKSSVGHGAGRCLPGGHLDQTATHWSASAVRKPPRALACTVCRTAALRLTKDSTTDRSFPADDTDRRGNVW